VFIFNALILNNIPFTGAMWFRSFSLLSQSSFDSSIVQNTSNIIFFISPQKKDTNHKKYFTIQYLSNEEKSFS